MISFLASIAALIIGYLLYGKFVEKVFAPDSKAITPAYSKRDGVDYIPMPTWKVYMIQFLNIAGTGPIFGAIMGAKFGPSSYLWIVFGCIFAGAVHDYLSGMLSIRSGGLSLPNLIERIMGKNMKRFMLVLIVGLLLLAGAVFIYSPAMILGDLTGGGTFSASMIWVGIIIAYYVIATLLPIDKIIGKIYPVFAFALLFMAVSLFVCLVIKWPSLPEIWQGLDNKGEALGLAGKHVFPCLFITIACGAISGFHATQSPMMARCIKNENLGRKVFYGSMISEGLVAVVWAGVSSYFFYDGGAAEVGLGLSAQAPEVVTAVSKYWLGAVGGVLAILGVVAAPITTGDTVFRSARLIIADALHISQERRGKRLAVACPIFLAAGILLWFNISDPNGFNAVWCYFGWLNQTIATITLWMLCLYLKMRRRGAAFLIAEIPAVFMTVVVVSYICMEKIGFNLGYIPSIIIGAACALVCALFFNLRKIEFREKSFNID